MRSEAGECRSKRTALNYWQKLSVYDDDGFDDEDEANEKNGKINLS